jgi:hypothetical protein
MVEASKQVDTQAKAFASVAVSFLAYPKDLQAADHVLSEHALAGPSAVVGLLLGGECDGLAAAFIGRATVRMSLGQTLVAAVSEPFGVGVRTQLAALEEPESVLSPLAAGHCQDRAGSVVDGPLAFQRVALLLARVAGALLFFGRSTGLSVTSTAMTCHGGSTPPIFRRPGNANAPLLTSVFSTRWIVRRTVFSATCHSAAKW